MNLATEIQSWNDYPQPPEFGHDDLDDIVAYERAEERGCFVGQVRDAVIAVARQYVVHADEINPDDRDENVVDFEGEAEDDAQEREADTWRAAALELLVAFGVDTDAIQEGDMGDKDLPQGYRWATAEESEDWENIPGARMVPRTVDSRGVAYTQGEADLAVPATDDETED